MKPRFNIFTWNNIHAVLFCFLLVLYTVLPVRYPVIIAGGISFFYYWAVNFEALKAYKPFAGYANWITLLRLLLIFFTVTGMNQIPDFGIFFIGLTIFVLDGLDGLIARKFKQESEFGAYFDMETDAFFVCIFTIIIYEKGLAGYWIIIPGFMRYLYGFIIWVTGKKNDEEIKSKIGPLIAGLFFSAVLTPFILPEKYYLPVLVVSSALLMLSFLYSFIRIFKVRKPVS